MSDCRRACGWLIIPVLIAAAGCEPGPTAPASPVPVSHRRSADRPLAWSPDGRTIAYRRIISSSDGPPGVYLLDLDGGKPRWVLPANILGPEPAHFSPDSRYLLLSPDGQARVVDRTTGEVTKLFHAARGVVYPDWLSNDRIIFRPANISRLDPPDSFAIGIFDLKTGIRSALRINEQLVFGIELAVSRLTGEIAIDEYLAPRPRIILVSLALDSVRTLFQPSGSSASLELLQWLEDPLTGKSGLAFVHTTNALRPTLYVDRSGGPATVLSQVRFPWDRFAPDGKSFLHLDLDPTDSTVVIFRHYFDDPLGRPPEQITHWSPP